MGLKDLVMFPDGRDDPYLQDPDLDDDASDVEDLKIKPDDNIVLVGHMEGDKATLEVYGERKERSAVIVNESSQRFSFPVYNDNEDGMYVHHDLLLPSPPMALEWMSYDPGEDTKGSFVAVGGMGPVIEVWDLDLIDCLEPAYSLGSEGGKKKKGKKGKRVTQTPETHTDAVLSLAWNHHVE